MNPRNSEPTTEADEEVPPWPERGPEIAARATTDPDADGSNDDVDDVDDADGHDDGARTGTRATVPQPDPEPIPLPGPDPVPQPVPEPVPPPPGPEPVPRPEPDPAPEPGPVTSPAPQATGTDEGSAGLDADDDDAPRLDLALHEEPEAEVTPVDDDVDVELEVETAASAGTEGTDDELLDHTDGAEGSEVATTAALAGVAADDVVDRPLPELPEPATVIDARGRPLLTGAAQWEDRWTSVQAAFVDDPGLSIQQADRLVTEAMEEVARLLLARRESLQDRWRTADPPPDTEQLRITIQGYRALLYGLLAAEPA